jgi:hypothetical protein
MYILQQEFFKSPVREPMNLICGSMPHRPANLGMTSEQIDCTKGNNALYNGIPSKDYKTGSLEPPQFRYGYVSRAILREGKFGLEGGDVGVGGRSISDKLDHIMMPSERRSYNENEVKVARAARLLHKARLV